MNPICTRITKQLFWLGKTGFVIGALLGGNACMINAVSIHNRASHTLDNISATIAYGVLGYIIGVTAPVSFPLILITTKVVK